MDWVWLVTDDQPLRQLGASPSTSPGARVDEAALAQWLAPAAGQALGSLSMVDPMGHWMMRFPRPHGCRWAQPRPRRIWNACCAPLHPGMRRADPGSPDMDAQPLYDLAPLTRLMLLGLLIALGPLAWVRWRNRGLLPLRRLQALTVLTLFLPSIWCCLVLSRA